MDGVGFDLLVTAGLFYILVVNSLSDTWITDIVSQSVNYLLIFLMMPLDELRFLIEVRFIIFFFYN